MAQMWQCKQNYLLDIDLPYPLAIFFFRMAHPVELNPYEHAKWVQMYGWKCLICSFEAKNQVGLNCSILLTALCTSMVLMDQSRYTAINARKHTMWLVSVQINQNQQDGPFCAAFKNWYQKGSFLW